MKSQRSQTPARAPGPQSSNTAPVCDTSCSIGPGLAQQPQGQGQGNQGTPVANDPATFTTKDKTATEHAEPIVGPQFQPPNGDKPMGSTERIVRVLHDKNDPLEVKSGHPAESDLVEDAPLDGTCDATDSGEWRSVQSFLGTVNNPAVLYKCDPDAIYVGGKPSPDDVVQGAIGDCYFMSVLADVAATDPTFLTSKLIKDNGQTVTFNFWSYDEAKGYTAAPITIGKTVLRYADSEGDPKGIVGASIKPGSKPTHSAWYAQAKYDFLAIVRGDYVACAMWVALAEKAYARFAEKYGQYGGYDPKSANKQKDKDGNALSGYKVIDGGWESLVFPVLYGPRMVDSNETNMSFTAGGNIATTNLPAIANLLRLSGEGVPKGQKFMMTASVDDGESARRLGAIIDYHRGDPDLVKYPELVNELKFLGILCHNIANAKNDKEREHQQSRLAKAADQDRRPDAWPILHSGHSAKKYRDLNEHLNIVADEGHGKTEGQRQISSNHAYSVLSATFVDGTGAPVALTQANLATAISKIDPIKSTVALRNPHGTDIPNPDGTASKDPNDGRFTLTLDQFLRQFAMQSTGLVQ